MENYKGIYHSKETPIKYYEFGAHFKYSELFESLKNLQNLQNDKIKFIYLNENSPKKNQEEIEMINNRMKYKFKNVNKNNNNRYLRKLAHINEDKKDENNIIINNNLYISNSVNKRKKIKILTKSLDKIKLPKIDMKPKEILSPLKIREEKDLSNYRLKKISKSINLKGISFIRKKEEFPKINGFHNYNNEILQKNNNDNQIIDEETQSIFKNNDNNKSLKIYDSFIKRNIDKRNTLKKTYKIINQKPLDLDMDNNRENNLEILPKSDNNNIKINKLKSIFEKEKEIKKNNLFLGQKNNYSYNNQNLKIENMDQYIHNLKRQLLSYNNENK